MIEKSSPPTPPIVINLHAYAISLLVVALSEATQIWLGVQLFFQLTLKLDLSPYSELSNKRAAQPYSSWENNPTDMEAHIYLQPHTY